MKEFFEAIADHPGVALYLGVILLLSISIIKDKEI